MKTKHITDMIELSVKQLVQLVEEQAKEIDKLRSKVSKLHNRVKPKFELGSVYKNIAHQQMESER